MQSARTRLAGTISACTSGVRRLQQLTCCARAAVRCRADCGGVCKRCVVGKRCLGDGDCIVGSVCSATAATCSCPDGFGGANCQTRVSTCESSNPCKNGECMPVPGASPDYTCFCKSGFAGLLCERNCWAEGLIADPADSKKCVACGKDAQFQGTRCGEATCVALNESMHVALALMMTSVLPLRSVQCRL